MAKLTMEQFQKKVERWRRRFPNVIEAELRRGGEIVIHEIHEKHLSGPKMERGEGDLTNATLQPQTGRLKTSINYRVRSTSKETSLTVGTNVVYAGVHEYGFKKRNIPKRPFLWPSVQTKRSLVMSNVAKAIVRAYEGDRGV